MAAEALSKAVAQAALDAVVKYGSIEEAARRLGIPRTTLHSRLEVAERYGLKVDATKDKDNPRLLRKRIEHLERDLKKAETASDETEILKRAIGTINSKLAEAE